MKERPIIFNTEMVRALMEGRKTQTRRAIKPQPGKGLGVGCYCGEGYPTEWVLIDEDGDPIDVRSVPCPYGKVGDRLWVKETYSTYPLHYKAAGYELQEGEGHWHSSIFMRRILSRITLEIVKIRVERLQEITEEDVVREGIPCRIFSEGMALFYYHDGGHCTEALPVFAHLWDSLNTKHPWDSNPWVWVIEFRRITNDKEKE